MVHPCLGQTVSEAPEAVGLDRSTEMERGPEAKTLGGNENSYAWSRCAASADAEARHTERVSFNLLFGLSVRGGGGTGNSNLKFFYYHPALGPKFIRRLAGETELTLFRDNRQSVDWLSTGKFSLCFFCYPQEVARAQKQGLPVAEFKHQMKEGAGLTSHSGQIGLINKAAHPNAAKVFLNWLLSREGQLTLQRVYSEGRRGASNSRRIDIPKDMIPPEDRLVEEVEYLDVETPERREMAPVIKTFEEALAQAEKKR